MLVGKPGSGKTRAAEHLAKRFSVNNLYDIKDAMKGDLPVDKLNIYESCDFSEIEKMDKAGWVVLCVYSKEVTFDMARGAHFIRSISSDASFFDDLDKFVDMFVMGNS